MLPASTAQSFLFPQGFFCMNKLKAKDAIYLNLLAFSGLEHGSITVDELEALAKSRSEESRLAVQEIFLNSERNSTLSNESVPLVEKSNALVNTTETVQIVPDIEKPTVKQMKENGVTDAHKTTPKYPFRKLRDCNVSIFVHELC